MTKLHGYALISAARLEADEIAREDRAELMRDCANEIEKLILENRNLIDALEMADCDLSQNGCDHDENARVKTCPVCRVKIALAESGGRVI